MALIQTVDPEQAEGQAKEIYDTMQETVGMIPAGGMRLDDRLEEIEKAYITEAHRRCDNVVTRAADLLHINVRALRYRIKKYKIARPG